MHIRRFVLFILVVQIVFGLGGVSAANASAVFDSTQQQVASFPFSDDFESGALGSPWIADPKFQGVVEINADYPHSGSKSVFLGQRTAGAVSASLILPIDLTGKTDVFLDFWVRRVGNPGYGPTTGLFFSTDAGTNWEKIDPLLPLNNTGQRFSHEVFNIATIVSAHQLKLDDKFRIRFTYDITSNNLNSGLIIDDVRLTTQANEFATFPYPQDDAQDDFEAEAFRQGVYPQSWGEGVVEFNTDYHHSGNKSVFLGQKVGGAVSASLVMAIDLTEQTDVFLDFWVRRVGSPGYGPTTGVFISADEGVNWKQVLGLSNTAQSFSHHLINITSADLPLNNKFRIRFTYDITSSNLNSGLIIDDVRLTTQANEFATFPYLHDDFETETFRQGMYPQSWFNGVAEFNTDYPHSGSKSVFLGQKVPGSVSASLIMGVDLTGQTDVLLDFWVRRVGNPGYGPSTGVFISADEGANWEQILGLNNTAQSFNHQTLNISSAANTHNLPLNNKFRIRFTYDINGNNSNDGLVIDDVKLIKTSISGKIYNEAIVAGNEVDGAFVQICNDNNNCQTTTSQAGGSYQFGDLPAGTYKLRALPPAGNTHLIGNLGPVTLVADTPLGDQHIILPKATGIPDGTTVSPALPPIDGVPTINWTTSVLLTHKGCASGTATYQVYVDGVVARSGAMTESPAGTYSVTLAPFRPVHGNIQLVINIRCPDNTQPTINFNIWIDPSGFVVNTFGAPIAGAKVSLYRSDSADGPFDPVTSGSAVMSPANRVNPMNTDSTGRFGWDVIAGYYRVRAEKAGCTAPGSNETFAETAVLTIPPPVTDLRIVLDCGGSAVFLPTVRR